MSYPTPAVVETTLIPVILCIREQIENSLKVNPGVYNPRPPRFGYHHHGYVPAFNPVAPAEYPDHHHRHPAWFQVEPGVNMVDWNQVHSGSVNPAALWADLANVDQPLNMLTGKAISDIFPSGRFITSNQQGVSNTLSFDSIVNEEVDDGYNYYLVQNIPGGGQSRFKLGFTNESGTLTTLPSVVGGDGTVLDGLHSSLSELSVITSSPRNWLAVQISNGGLIKNMEIRINTQYKAVPPTP